LAKKQRFELSDFGFDPDDSLGVRSFVGFLRQASDGWRLYLNVDFNDYVLIRTSDLVGKSHSPKDSGSLDVDIVWVRQGAILRRVTVRGYEMQADFLRGEIVREYMPNADPSVMYAHTDPTEPSGPTPCGPCKTHTLVLACVRTGLPCPRTVDYNLCGTA
jgi:hypothetical protein